MVYPLNVKPTQGYYVEYENLNGDMTAVTLIDDTPDEGGRPTLQNGGRPLDSKYVPTLVRWKDRKKMRMGDFDGGPFESVSARAKALIEQFEPEVHQFLPVEFVDIDGEFLESRWFLVICTRLDTIDREHVRGFLMKTYPSGASHWIIVGDLVRRNEIELIPSSYNIAQPPKLVFNREQIGAAHLWVDKHLSPGVWISDEFDAACDAAGLTGRQPEKKWQETV